MKIFYANSVRRQLSAGTNYRLIIVSPAIPHYTRAVVTGALLVRIGWQRLSVILLLVSHPASGRTPVVCTVSVLVIIKEPFPLAFTSICYAHIIG